MLHDYRTSPRVHIAKEEEEAGADSLFMLIGSIRRRKMSRRMVITRIRMLMLVWIMLARRMMLLVRILLMLTSALQLRMMIWMTLMIAVCMITDGV